MKPLSHPSLLAVVGTDTGVGKTVICTGLLHGLRRLGFKVAGFKPVETGIPEPKEGSLSDPADWERLERSSGQISGTALGVSFPLPAAPLAAARACGRILNLGLLEEKLGQLREDHDLVLLEGAGGLLVPFAENLLWGDFLQRLAPRCLVVGRLGLGSINHTLLTLEALGRRGIPVLGVMLSSTEPAGPEARYTPELIADFSDIVVFDPLPWGIVDPAKVADHLLSSGLLGLIASRHSGSEGGPPFL